MAKTMRMTRAVAAGVLLFLPLCGGCAPVRGTHASHPPKTAAVYPGEPSSPQKTKAYALFSAAVAADLQASHLEELYTHQNLSSGIKQPSLIRDARKLRSQAASYLDDALALDPGAHVVLRKKGDVLLRSGEVDEALKAYFKAEEAGRAESAWYFRTARQLEGASKYGDAAKLLEMATAAPADMPDDLRLAAYIETGTLYARVNELDRAREAYEKALVLAASHPAPTGTRLGTAISEGVERDPTGIRRTLVGILRRQGKLDDALAHAEQAAKEAPRDPRTIFLLSAVYQAREEPGKAVASVERFVADNPGSAPGVFALVRVLADAGRVDEAVARGKEFLAAKGPSSPLAREIIRIYRDAGRSAEAEAFAASLGKAEELDPAVAVALLDLYLSEKRSDEAFSLATSILVRGRREPQIAVEVFGLIWSKLSGAEAEKFYAEYNGSHEDDVAASYGYARTLGSQGETEKAADVFVDLAEKGATFPRIYEFGAARLAGKGESYRAAAVLLTGVEKGAVEHPQSLAAQIVESAEDATALAERLEADVDKYQAALTTLYQTVARAYGKAGANAKAEEYYRKALESPEPSLADYAGLAASLYRQDKNAEAIELVTSLRKQGRGLPPLLRMLASMLSKEGKFEQARSLAQELIRNQPRDVDNYVTMAGAYMEHEDYAEAANILVTAQDLAEGDETATANVRYLLGVVYEEQGSDDLAVSMWRANLQSDPAEADSNNALAYHYAQKGTDLEEALLLVAKALEKDPANGAYLDTLGWIQYKKGDFEEAVETLSKASAGDRDAVILDHLGDAYLASGDAQAALGVWKEALSGRVRAKDRARIEEKIRANFPGELGN